MSKVILINRPPNFIRGLPIPTRKWQPLNLVHIASGLKRRGIETEIIDARASNLGLGEIKELLREKKPEIVLVSSDSCDLYECPSISMDSFFEIVKAAGEIDSIRNIIAIGPQATIFDKDILTKTAVDYIVKGDNPVTAIDLIYDLFSDKKSEYDNVSYNLGEELSIGKVKHLENLDQLPVGDYSLLPVDRYASNMEEFPPGKFSIAIISRGCFGKCKFCFKDMIGSKFRGMSVRRARQELDAFTKAGVEVVYFLDDLFTFDYDWARRICQMMIEGNYNIKWGAQTRPDRMTEELLGIMKKAGCFYISYGVESGSQAVINRSRKNIDLGKAEEIIKKTKEMGIKVHLNMMYGYPGENREEFMETIDFSIRNKEVTIPCPIIYFYGCEYFNELTPDKSLRELEKISLNLSLSNLKQKDIEKGLAKINLYRMWVQKDFNLGILYFLIKYFFPGLTYKIRKRIRK
ncbi:B12-binding domain-containing radical SAM protein [Candidatus Falkowbacteria bacterium]|nr:B12-binding domain-containing radical SAM protein [Candidatus Falkowbacteria bacterium]